MSTGLFHLVLEKSRFHKVLAHCQGVVERRNTVPVLSHILLEARDNLLKVTATDLDLSFVETLPATIHSEGKTTVPAHLLFDVVRKLPDGMSLELKMEKEGKSLEVSSPKSSYTFSCLPTTDFPLISEETLPCLFKMPTAEFATLIDKTRFSMSTEETRYYLNGIFFHPTPQGFLRAVATDGLRLAQAQVPLPEAASSMPSVIMSRKTIQEVRKLIEEVEGDITLSLSENQVRFSIGSSILISRLIEGKFPDYEQVIPLNNDKILDVDVKNFAESVDRVSLMSTDKLRPIKIHVENKTMSISAQSTETGSAHEEIDIIYNGPPLNLGLNAKFVLDVTHQITGPTLLFLIGEEHQAILLKDVGTDTTLYVLMPMRV